MAKNDKEYCEKNIEFSYKGIMYRIIAVICSFVCKRYFGASGVIYYWIMNGITELELGEMSIIKAILLVKNRSIKL